MVAISRVGILRCRRALERWTQPGYEERQNVLDSWTGSADDGDAGLDGCIGGGDTVAVYFALEGIEQPEQSRNADRDDDETEGQERDGDEFALERHLKVPDNPSGYAAFSSVRILLASRMISPKH